MDATLVYEIDEVDGKTFLRWPSCENWALSPLSA